MTECESGDVVLVRFPFTDLTSTKKRPALVLSDATYSRRYGDVVVLALTSQDQQESSLALAHWQAAGLLKATWAKPVVGTISGSLIERQLGRLDQRDAPPVRAALAMLLAAQWR